MIEDMRLRKLNGKTQIAYIRAVRRLAGFLRRSPDTATAEDLRRFQLHMVDQGTSSLTINATISGLRFFFEITLERGHLMMWRENRGPPSNHRGTGQEMGKRPVGRWASTVEAQSARQGAHQWWSK